MEELDYVQLRGDLIRYYEDIGSIEMEDFGTAMGFFPAATVDLIQAENRMNGQIAEVRNASNERLEAIASSLGFDLDDYRRKGMRF